MSNDYRGPIDRADLERILANAREILDGEEAADIEKRHAALEDLKAIREEVERRLSSVRN